MAWITQIFILYISVATSHGHGFFGNHHDISDLPDIISKVVNHNLQHSLFHQRGFMGNGDMSSGGNYGNPHGPNNVGLSYIRPGIMFGSQELMDQRSNLGSQESGELIQNPSNSQVPVNSLDVDNTYATPTVDIPKQIIGEDLVVNQTNPNLEVSENHKEQNIPGTVNEHNINVISHKLDDGVPQDNDLSGIVEHLDASGLTKNLNNSDVSIDIPQHDDDSADSVNYARKENEPSSGLKTNVVVNTIDNKLQNSTSVGLNKNRNENSIVFPDKVDAIKVSEVKDKDAHDGVNMDQSANVPSRNSEDDNNPILYAVKIVPALVSKTKPKINKNFPVLTSNNEATTNDQSNGSPVQYVVQNPPNGYNYVNSPSNTGNNYPGQVYMSNNVPPSSGSQTNGYYQIPNSGQQYYTVQLSNGQSALVPVNNGQMYVPNNIQNSPQSQILVSGNGQQYVPNNGNSPIYLSGNGQQYVSNSGQPVSGNNQQYALNNGQQYVSSGGQPVQDNGQQYVIINGQQYVASNSQPVQGNGQQYVLNNGQQYLQSSGQPVQGNGQQYVLNNGQQYVPITQGNSQTYVPNNGQQYVTSNGQVLVSGTGQQYVPSNGQVAQGNGQVLIPDNSQQYVPIQSNGQQYVSSSGQNIAPSGYVSWPYNSDQNTVQNNGQVYVPVNGQIQNPQSNIITVPSGSLVTIGDSVPLLVLKDKDEHSASASTSSEEDTGHEDEKKSENEDEDKLKKF